MEPSIRPLSPPKAGYPTSEGPKIITNEGRSPTTVTPTGNLSPRSMNARSNHKNRKSCKDVRNYNGVCGEWSQQDEPCTAGYSVAHGSAGHGLLDGGPVEAGPRQGRRQRLGCRSPVQRGRLWFHRRPDNAVRAQSTRR